jgi:hypothetical protein
MASPETFGPSPSCERSRLVPALVTSSNTHSVTV